MQRVISYYALTDRFRHSIELQSSGKVEFSAVGGLRNLSMGAMLREIRRLKASRMSVAIESDSARPLAGPLMLLAALTGTPRIGLIWPDGHSEEVPRWKVARYLFEIMKDQISSRIAYRIAAREASKLDRFTPLNASQPVADSKAVLFLDANLSFGVVAGGSVGHTKGVIDGFIGKGFAVDYASVKQIPTDRPRSRGLQVPAPSLYSFPVELNYYSFGRIYERYVEGWARKRSYAFLYQRMSMHNYSGARLRNRLNIPLVLEYNGSEAWASANWAEKLVFNDMAVAMERIALRNADLVITVSKILGEEVAAAGVPQERIVVYPNCIDPEIFDPSRFSNTDNAALRKRWDIPADAMVATFVGTFGTWHGVDFLANAVCRLINEDRDWVERNRLHFLFVGDGLKMPAVRATLDDPKYRSFVTLTGLVSQNQAPAYLATSDIFLSPHMPNPDGTAFFGSPTKLFEYMAMARPIIASDLDQIGKVLRGTYLSESEPEKPLAELFTPGDEEGFLVSLRRVVENPLAAADMAKRARRAALNSFTWNHHVGAILDRMQKLGLR